MRASLATVWHGLWIWLTRLGLLLLLPIAVYLGWSSLWPWPDDQLLALASATAEMADADGESADSAGGEALARLPCGECGVIESSWTVQAGPALAPEAAGAGGPPPQYDGLPPPPAGYYLLRVRMQDGSYRIFTERMPAYWRDGARVIVISGR